MKKLLSLAAPAALVVALAAPAGAAPTTVTSADFPTAKQVAATFPTLKGVKRTIEPTGALVRSVNCTRTVPVKAKKSRSASYDSDTSTVSVLVSVAQLKSTKQAKTYMSGARVMNRCGKVTLDALDLDLTSRAISAPELGSERVGQSIDFGFGVRGLMYSFRKGARVVEVMTVFTGKKPTAKARKVAAQAYRAGV